MQSRIKKSALCLTVMLFFVLVPYIVAQSKPMQLTSVQSKSAQFASTIRSDQAFSMLQKHYFLGRWQVFVNKDKVKAVNLGEEYSIVTMAPTWKVMFYRDKGGAKMYETTMREFLIAGIPLSSYYTIEGKLGDARETRTKYKSMSAVEFVMTRRDRTREKPAWTMADMPKEFPVVMSRYWLSPEISTDITLCRFVQRLFMLPPTDRGYPLAFVDTRSDRSQTAVVDILSCRGLPEKDVVIAYPSPAKYKVCKAQRDVTLSTEKKDSLSDWAEAIGKD